MGCFIGIDEVMTLTPLDLTEAAAGDRSCITIA
jgi:hypothetical protein